MDAKKAAGYFVSPVAEPLGVELAKGRALDD
jgi:hypothetical protein